MSAADDLEAVERLGYRHGVYAARPTYIDLPTDRAAAAICSHGCWGEDGPACVPCRKVVRKVLDALLGVPDVG